MKTHLFIGPDYAPAMGDIRALLPGDCVWLQRDADQRPDWGRYLDALASAISHGVDIRWLR